MKRNTLAACLVIMLATLTNGLQSATGWVKHESAEGRYSVLMPTQPKVSLQEGTAATGETMTQHLAGASDADSQYSVAYFDVLPNLTYSLDKGRDGMVSAVNGTLLSEAPISLGGNAGRDLKLSAKNSGYEFMIRARFWETQGRVFILQHVYLKSSDSPATAQKTAKFFDSFKMATGR